ncbi:galactose-binding domain-containing protein [Kitasatospora kifunensis]|uniref:alpha-L-fucosidase n=1 Tax=Kitasatospora kifunensis TaxID=58351 RepID=A0A7W7RAX5_KITKI|nr:discoidin domain-containing protein [Kitasatospora kifunensis]MBB4928675.1 alpha-L-fucosidase [Kitasatospora kifunensis]
MSAVRAAGLRVGLYYSPIDWRYPGYYDVTGAKPPSPVLTSDCVLSGSPYPWNYEGSDPAGFDYHENARTLKNEVYQSVKELVTDYGAVDDVSNSRSGRVGDYDIEEGGYVSTGPIRFGRLVQKAFSISGTTWGYDGDVAMSFSQAMAVFVNAFVRDMCVIVNVGPDATGTVASKQAAVLRQVGTFMSANHEALYGTRGGPWNPVEGQYGFTFANQTVYAHLLAGYSGGSSFTTPSLGDAKVTAVYDVVSKGPLSFSASGGNSVTVTDIDRTRYPDDTIVAIVLDRSVVPADIARGCPATADSVESAHGNPAANAVDGDTSTRWCAADGNTGHWLQVDLGSVQSIGRVVLNWEYSHATAYQLQVSNDASSWATVYSTTSGSGGVENISGLSGSGRYVRMYGTARATQWSYSLFSMQVFSS